MGRGCLRGGGDAKFYIIATQSSLFPKNTSSIRMGGGAGLRDGDHFDRLIIVFSFSGVCSH